MAQTVTRLLSHILERMHRYIAQQKQHYNRLSFRDELLQLLKKHRVQYDGRYLWD